MKTLLPRLIITLLTAAGATLLAGCLEQSRQAAAPVPVTAAPAPIPSDPEIIARPDPSGADVSAPVAEVARLHLAGLEETVVKAFVEKSTNSASPTANELIYLKDIGVSPRVITAMIQQTAKMRELASAAPVARANPPAGDTRPNMTVISAPTPAAFPASTPAPAAPATPQTTPPAVASNPAPAPAPPAVATPAPASLPSQVNIFYQHLQPYGTWMQVAEHGWCWQPSVVISSPNWRPYADRGRWLHTDSGWYWQSDYAWGWAPFHYGRWVLHARSGWLWVPDDVWGPAWVVWRSSSTYCGWAPLPPSAVFVAGRGLFHGGTRVSVNFDFGLPRNYYTFVPFNRFCDRNPFYHAVGPTVVQNVFNQTTVINNIEVNNNVIVNNGVPADRVAALTRSEIRKVTVLEAAPQAVGISRLDRLEKSGNDLVIYRPTLNPNAPIKPMALTDEKGVARHVWTPAGALDGQKIKGRPVFDTTSTGVPVLTGYTTEPPASPAISTVVINNTITAAPVAPPAKSSVSAGASLPPDGKPASATKVFGITPSVTTTKRSEERSQPLPNAVVTSPGANTLFRPITPPQPVTSSSPNLITPTPVVSAPKTPVAPQPVATYQPVTRTEVVKPAVTAVPAAVASPAPATRQVAPVAPAPVSVAPAAPSYTPPPPRPVPVPVPTVQVQPAAPVPARPTVVINPPPQPSSVPAAPPANNSTPGRKEQEKKR